MKFNLSKISTIAATFVLILFSFGCQTPESAKTTETNTKAEVSPTAEKKISKEKFESPDFVDVPKLANRSAAEFDEVFGKPLKITEVKNNPAMMPGEVREYKVEGHPKNLSVRFYKDRAKRFNLLLGKPERSSKRALKNIFKVDVENKKPDKKSSPLSEKWKGKIDGVDFVTLYAKREKSGSDFIMLHAEVVK